MENIHILPFKIEEDAENYSLELLEAKTIQPHEKKLG